MTLLFTLVLSIKGLRSAVSELKDVREPFPTSAGPARAFTGSCGAAARFEELSPSSGAEDSPGGGAVRLPRC